MVLFKNKNAFNPIVKKIFGSMQSFYFHYSTQCLKYWFHSMLGILIQSNTSNNDSIQYLKYWFNPIPWILVQSNAWNIDSMQYLEHWFNAMLGILIHCNTWNVDSIQYLEYWFNLTLKFDSIFLGRANLDVYRTNLFVYQKDFDS